MKSNLFTPETAGSQFVSCDRVGKHQNRRPSPSDRARARSLTRDGNPRSYSPSGKRRGNGGGLKELERLIALFKKKTSTRTLCCRKGIVSGNFVDRTRLD